MCGIVGYTGEREAAPILLEGLKKLEYRGYDSAGLAILGPEGIMLKKVSGRIDCLAEKTEGGKLLPGTDGIGHTRWATHGAPTDMNAHPHLSNDRRFAIVHNGIIENFASIREELTSEGYAFHSETDTEVVVHLLEKYYAGDLKAAVMKTTARLRGSYALGILCRDFPGRIFAVREASPLILGLGVGENYFASDVTALVSHTKNVIYLDDGEFAEIRPDGYDVYDCTGRPVEKKISRVTWSVEAAEKGGYPHFMLKEMTEEPDAVRKTLMPRMKEEDIVLDDLSVPDDFLRNVDRILITACGSAYYAGCTGKIVIEKLCRIPVWVELASELRYADPILSDRTLVIVISQSGETADSIAAMKEAKSRGAKTFAIVNVVGSTIAKLADYTIYTWAGPEIAVATTKGFTTQLSMLYLIALYIAKHTGRIDAETFAMLYRELKRIPKLMQETIDRNTELEALAKRLKDAPAIFYLGRNTDYAISLEGALKMKEISYIHAEAYAAGELKHGTIALISEGVPVIALCCNEELTEKMMSNVIEVKARGAYVIVTAFSDNTRATNEGNALIRIPRIHALFSGILEILPLQLLAYYTAKENGCDIDKPKNLAKSVTVE